MGIGDWGLGIGLIGKCDIRDIEEINERLGKSNKTNNIDNPSK